MQSDPLYDESDPLDENERAENEAMIRIRINGKNAFDQVIHRPLMEQARTTGIAADEVDRFLFDLVSELARVDVLREPPVENEA